jgi:transcriptional regulator with XRE-family HTH domain
MVKTVGEKIRYFRRLKGWTLDRLAVEVNYKENAVHNFETGKRKTPQPLLKVIAIALGIEEILLLEEPLLFNDEKDFIFKGDRFLEEVEKDVPEAVLSWLRSFKGVEEEYGYPAFYRGDYGFALVMEFWHSGQKDDICKDWQEENPEKTEDLVLDIIKTSAALIGQLETHVDVLVGDKTGVLDCHELIVFFKYGKNNDYYKQVFETIQYSIIRAERAHGIKEKS